MLITMMRTVVFPEEALPAKLKLNPECPLTDDEYFDFCMANPDLGLERTAEGEIVIVPPAGGESSYRSGDSFGQLRIWSQRDGKGKAFDSSAQFVLPSGAALSPNAAWVSNQRLAQLSKEQKRKFPPVCPEFVIEVMSPSDRLKEAKAKMEEWIRAGVELAWLIDGDARTVYIYRAGQAGAEVRNGILSLEGEGPVEGFELALKEIWEGL